MLKKVPRIRTAAPPSTIRSSESLIAIAYKYSLTDIVTFSHVSQRLSADISRQMRPYAVVWLLRLLVKIKSPAVGGARLDKRIGGQRELKLASRATNLYECLLPRRAL